MRTVRIGNGCGFWGDNLDAPVRLVETARLDYLTLEYLAELTMSILALQKQRDSNTGFATDFLEVVERLCPHLRDQSGLKIITNAGGMNSNACAARVRAILDKAGLSERKIGVVSGDDLTPRLHDLVTAGHVLANLDTGGPFSAVRERVVSANAYLGAPPIVEALKQGASVVIAGRVADASLTVAPAMHEFGWEWDDWNRLGAATVAGHLIECGAQSTGGLWCNWQEADDLANVGYPIAEMEENGAFILTKPENSGGRVNTETVAEQLLYEVGDPAAYLTPDVTANFSSVRLTPAGRNRVRVDSARGGPATDSYKVSIAYRDGFTSSGTLLVAGPDAVAKAKKCGAIILNRLQRAGVEFAHSNIECLGAGAGAPGVIAAQSDPPEVMLRVSVRDPRKQAVERFTKEFAPLVTSGPPGITGYTTGRPQVREVFAYWPALLAKGTIKARVEII
jgi:hypothetical protein